MCNVTEQSRQIIKQCSRYKQDYLNLVCSKCKKQFGDLSTALRHFVLVHKIKDHCVLCQKMFLNKTEIYKHIRVCHPEGYKRLKSEAMQFIDQRCNIDNAENTDSMKNINARENTRNATSIGNKCPCPICNQNFNNMAKVVNHFIFDHKVYKDHCLECNARMTTQRESYEHLKSAHPSKMNQLKSEALPLIQKHLQSTAENQKGFQTSETRITPDEIVCESENHEDAVDQRDRGNFQAEVQLNRSSGEDCPPNEAKQDGISPINVSEEALALSSSPLNFGSHQQQKQQDFTIPGERNIFAGNINRTSASTTEVVAMEETLIASSTKTAVIKPIVTKMMTITTSVTASAGKTAVMTPISGETSW